MSPALPGAPRLVVNRQALCKRLQHNCSPCEECNTRVLLMMRIRHHKVKEVSSAKNISIRAEWLRQSGRAPSEPSETPLWQTTPRPAPIGRVALHIALRSRFRRFVSLCRYPIVNVHRGVVANCDHTSEWVHWVRQQNVYRSGSHTQGSISTRLFVYHIRLCYSHKIRYLIIWHALFRYLYIYTSTAVNPPSTFRHTSRDIQTEFVRKNGSSSRSLGRK